MRSGRMCWAVALIAVSSAAVSPLAGQEPDSAAVEAEWARQDSLRRVFDSAAAFAPLPLPAPDDRRTSAGAPGEGYWQQRADYDIDVVLDAGRHTLTGRERITYTNNSPDSLRSLWLQLDQNLFRRDSYGAQRAEALGGDVRHGGFFDDGGFDLAAVTLERDGETVVPEYRVEDTMMEILLDEPLAPAGGELSVDIEFSFVIPETGGDRMGRQGIRRGIIYQLAQWYPRVFTYDDVNGWNQSPFLGQGEWYLEYGDFDVSITVPRDFIVTGTGELQNDTEVLTTAQLERLDVARMSVGPVMIVDEDEAGDGSTRPLGDSPLTWNFRAENVRDFAWAASDRFIWDAAGYEDVLVMSFYPEESIGTQGFSGWERSTEYLRHSVKHYSEKWFPYPYPVAINVAGLALGMEYPMIVFCHFQARGAFLFSVTDHEIGHTWFPMLVGSDERRYAWMDEGFNTFINYYSGIDFSGGDPILAGLMAPGQIADDTRRMRQPLITPADSIPEADLGVQAYNKPAAVLVLLREQVMGPEVFDAAFRAYIEEWAYKHPQPADFIRVMEDAAGRDLDWFFRGWVYENGVLDQALASVARNGDTTVVTLENRGGIAMPVVVRVVYQDGTEELLDVAVERWAEEEQITLELTGGRVRHVQLDPNGALPDVDRSNNVWGRGVLGRRPGTSSR